FDEPYTGLDQDASARLDTILKTVAARGRTVLMISHDLAHALALADRVAILSRGKIAYDAPTAGLNPLEFANTYKELTQ
ncbi:MAG: sodium ABC transporter ATP-binding protein, partial [Chloroflexota bacterium]